jgi:hypothetical protein
MASYSADASEQRLHAATRTLHKEMHRFGIRSFGSIRPVSCTNDTNAQVPDKPYKNLAPKEGFKLQMKFSGMHSTSQKNKSSTKWNGENEHPSMKLDQGILTSYRRSQSEY